MQHYKDFVLVTFKKMCKPSYLILKSAHYINTVPCDTDFLSRRTDNKSCVPLVLEVVWR